MSRHDGLCCLLVLVLLVATPYALAQATDQPVTAPAPVQTQPQAPAAAPAQAAVPTPGTPAPGVTTPAAPAAVPPGPPLSPEELGDSLSARKRYQAAIAAYSKVTKPSAELWNKMGIAYQMMFDPQDAIRCYRASLKLEPRSSTVLNNLATVYDSLKKYGDAERTYRKALKIDPHSALIHRNLGSNQLTQHKYKKGWQSYKAALEIDPQIFQSRSGVNVENPASVQERGAMHYYMAKGCVTAGNSECAIHNLRMALNEGYINPKKIAADGSFASLRELAAFQTMIAAQSSPQ